MVDFTLTDEQKSIRELAHDFAEKEIRPRAWEYDKEGTWPQGITRPRLPRRGPDRGGARLGLLGNQHVADLQRPGDRAGHPRRLGGVEEGVPRRPGRGAAARILLPDRARRRLRRLSDQHDPIFKLPSPCSGDEIQSATPGLSISAAPTSPARTSPPRTLPTRTSTSRSSTSRTSPLHAGGRGVHQSRRAGN